jgi:hypothetical protein
MAEKAERAGGLRLPASTVLAERLRIASDMLSLTLKEAALLPVREQEQVRLAVRALQEVQAWCKRHVNGGTSG